MKRFLVTFLVLCLLVTQCVSAESLFNFLITPTPEKTDVKAPSYGGMAGVAADEVQDYAEHGQAVIYLGVGKDSYNDFVKYLGGLEYEVIKSNVTDQKIELIVSNGVYNIGISYTTIEERLTLIYDPGVEYETSKEETGNNNHSTKLPTPVPATVYVKEYAPSYGGMANVDPKNVQPYAEGGQAVTYENVDEQGYADFGDYLFNLGYKFVNDPIVEGRIVKGRLSDGKYNIGMIYDADEETMILIYEEGVDFKKKDEFAVAGYTRIKLGDEIKIDNFGTYKFQEYYFNKSIATRYTKSNQWITGGKKQVQSEECYLVSNSYLHFYYYDTSQNKTASWLIDGTLIYINENGTYKYPINRTTYSSYEETYTMGTKTYDMFAEARGALVLGTTYTYADSVGGYVEPLYGKDGMIGFSLPLDLINAKDGTLAIVLKIQGKEDYVLVLRENGQKIGDW